MNREFVAAITQLAAERNLPKELVVSILESALVSAYKKEVFSREQDISVKIDPNTADIKVYIRRIVADPVTEPLKEISLDEARELGGNVQLGDVVEVDSKVGRAGRIAAQTGRQVVLQRLREAEQHAVYERFVNREGEIASGTIQFIQPQQIYVNLGKTEAILHSHEQVPNERYHRGQQLKFYLLEIRQGVRGSQIIVSRSHPGLIRRLFEMEIPEVNSGIVEVKTVAREAGHRSKVAVSARQEGVDPVGCCLGARNIRLQSIITELNGEKIDVIQWDADPRIFIANALSPAQVAGVELNEAENTATVIVPDRQLSLAIGKEGQNAKLAAKLTCWRIDIKSTSTIEAEKAELAEAGEELEAAEEPLAVEETEAGEELKEGEILSAVPIEPEEPEPVEVDEVRDITTLLASDEFKVVTEASSVEKEGEPKIRFAEDILPRRPKAGIPSRGKDTKAEKGKAKAKGTGRKGRKVYIEDDESEE